MARKIIQKYLPNPKVVKESKILSVFGNLLYDPQLWHLTRYSVSHAFSLGLLCAWIPVPFQMPLVAALAILVRANLLISLSLVWVTNPLTMPFLFGFAYYVGSWFFPSLSGEIEFELSWEWLSNSLGDIWQPFLLGCAICGIISAILGHLFIRLFWRLQVANQWKLRKINRQLAHRKDADSD